MVAAAFRLRASATPLLLLLVLLLAWIACAFPGRGYAADDSAEAKGVVQRQAEAFARDDTAGAYSYASPEIQGFFPQSDTFMSMVRQGYAPVYRHKSFDLGETRVDGKRIEQDVRIIDLDGLAWEALYTLERQPDGSLKIVSCVLKQVGTTA